MHRIRHLQLAEPHQAATERLLLLLLLFRLNTLSNVDDTSKCDPASEANMQNSANFLLRFTCEQNNGCVASNRKCVQML